MNSADVLKFKGQSVVGLTPGATFLLACGHPLDLEKAKVIEQLAALFTDCGTIAPSTAAVRMSASCGAPIWQSLIAGIACFGEHHFPIEQAARFLCAGRDPHVDEVVPGFGHPYFKTRDPRVDAALELAKPYIGLWVQRAVYLETKLGVGLNPAGGAAAILSDMGVPPEAMPAIPLMGRMMGWISHIIEQRAMKPIMRAEQMKELL